MLSTRHLTKNNLILWQFKASRGVFACFSMRFVVSSLLDNKPI